MALLLWQEQFNVSLLNESIGRDVFTDTQYSVSSTYSRTFFFYLYNIKTKHTFWYVTFNKVI